jgi:DNA-binding transcriptional LysR family regulator
MELRHLRYFIAVAEELHFGRAAERLQMSQPPLSQQIRQLEDELGFALLIRTKRSVQLTEAGQYFLSQSQALLAQLQRTIQTGRQIGRGEAGQLAIGFVSSAAYNVLPEILRSFRDRYPQVALVLQELTTHQQLQELRSGRIDVAFLRPPVEPEVFGWMTIFEEPLAIALPETHPLAARSSIPIDALKQEAFITFPRSLAPGLFDCIVSLCQQANFSPIVVQEATQMQTIVSLVAAEMGIALVPASLRNLQRVGVVYRDIEVMTTGTATGETRLVSIALAWRKQETSVLIRNFIDML